MEEMSYVFLFTFFFTAAHFQLALVAAKFSHFLTSATKFFFALAPFAVFLVELRWPVDHFLFISVFPFLYIPNLWTISIDNTDREAISAFRFRLY